MLNSNLNTGLSLRFAEVDNINFFQFGVDNVRLGLTNAQADPEPST